MNSIRSYIITFSDGQGNEVWSGFVNGVVNGGQIHIHPARTDREVLEKLQEYAPQYSLSWVPAWEIVNEEVKLIESGSECTKTSS